MIMKGAIRIEILHLEIGGMVSYECVEPQVAQLAQRIQCSQELHTLIMSEIQFGDRVSEEKDTGQKNRRMQVRLRVVGCPDVVTERGSEHQEEAYGVWLEGLAEVNHELM